MSTPPELRPLTAHPFAPPAPGRFAFLRFRRFSTRLLLLLLGLVGAAQLAAFLAVARVHRADAHREIGQDLAEAARQFGKEIERDNDFLARTAEAVSGDYGFKQTFARTEDPATLRSALQSLKLRAKADVVACLSLDGRLLAETRAGPSAVAYYLPLAATAETSERLQATGYGMIDGVLYTLSGVPIRAPDVLAWVILGIRLDQPFIAGLRETSGVEITLRHRDRVLATTVARPARFLSVKQSLRLADGDHRGAGRPRGRPESAPEEAQQVVAREPALPQDAAERALRELGMDGQPSHEPRLRAARAGRPASPWAGRAPRSSRDRARQLP